MKDKIDKMKPFFTNDKNNSIIFDRFENQIPYSPIILFYDDYEEMYYYIKYRSAIDRKENLKEPINNEVFVSKSKKGLLTKDSYVDTSQIFRIPAKDLDDLLDKKDRLYLETEFLNKKDIVNIYESLLDNLKQEPPKVTVSTVWIEEEKINSYVEYSHEELLDEEFIKFQNKNKNNNEKIKKAKNLIEEIKTIRNKTHKIALRNLFLEVEFASGEFNLDNWDEEDEQELKKIMQAIEEENKKT
ncbi:Mbov_0400 family ICE element protein [Mycoplasmopsis cricetuli]|uniref:Mbov_0400 family ICE element protein n=1 Tax=Mycoplasmopsis cricetuli TaxID=171283 RepID=UPI00046ED2F9|nr:hypothetical protein [Mycoplasmopsis cricetuli]